VSNYLSKSDFKVARTCATKLYYKKLGYPSTRDDDEYMRFLADGGYMVEAIARLCHPDGIEIGFDHGPDASAQETMRALEAQETVTLFEATLISKQRLARVDILEKRGNRFRLIEVKAKSFHSVVDGAKPFRGKRGGIDATWRPYLEDVAFQTLILRSILPGVEVTPCLCLVDKAKTCGIDTIFQKFQLTSRSVTGTESGFWRPDVTFTGDVEALRRQPFLEVVDVTDEVDELMPEVREAASAFLATLSSGIPQRSVPPLGVHCKTCEYRVDGDGRNGFKECWGTLANPEPHLLDLYRVDLLGRNGETAARFIEEGRCSLLDVSESDLRGATGQRQRIQLEWTRKNSEFIDGQLPAILARCAYPLHFIDFETSRLAVPYHAGMRPYEQVAFQWSCHTIREPGGELTHTEWINTEDAYPNFGFARSLKDVLGQSGTIFIWSLFERTALRDIRGQLIKYREQDRELADWLDGITADGGPLVDLCQLAREHYFHPRMKGKLSLKYVLPAVWESNHALHTHPVFEKYYRRGADDTILNPYDTLQALPFGNPEDDDETAEVVREGTGAMRAYQEMLYGLSRNDNSVKDQWRRLLLQYCELDTAAMAMVWIHWSMNAPPDETR
jgi:hypothetical protein